MAPYQIRIILVLLLIMLAGLMVKIVDRHRRAVGFDVTGFLDGYKHTTVIDTVKPPVDISTNAMAVPTNEGEEISEAGAQPVIINVNQADFTTLMELPGVGPVLARRIIAYRDSVGHFAEPKDLLKVSGIGEKKLASMKAYLRF